MKIYSIFIILIIICFISYILSKTTNITIWESYIVSPESVGLSEPEIITTYLSKDTHTLRPHNSNKNINKHQLLYLDKSKAKHFFLRDTSARLYISSIEQNTIKHKIPKIEDLTKYYRFIQNFTKREKRVLKKMVNNLPSNKLLDNSWNFAKTSISLEFGMPFTLGNIIFLSSINITSSFKRTLVHEKIHILQRQHKPIFNKFLIEELGFRLVKRRGKIPFTIFSNPDGLQLDSASWIFLSKLDNKWYCPFLSIDKNGNLSRIAVQVEIISNNVVTTTNKIRNISNLLHSRFPTCPVHHLYHPYEIMAELGMKYIMDGTSGNEKIDNFYKLLD